MIEGTSRVLIVANRTATTELLLETVRRRAEAGIGADHRVLDTGQGGERVDRRVDRQLAPNPAVNIVDGHRLKAGKRHCVGNIAQLGVDRVGAPPEGGDARPGVDDRARFGTHRALGRDPQVHVRPDSIPKQRRAERRGVAETVLQLSLIHI